MNRPLALMARITALALLVGCGDDADSTAKDAAVTDAAITEDAAPREDAAVVEDASVTEDAQAQDAAIIEDAVIDAALIEDAAPLDAAVEDAEAPDASEGPDSAPLPELATRATLEPPADPLAASGLESCPVFGEARCVDGQRQRCQVRDVDAEAWIAEGDLDPLQRRVLLYDRWYDLYGSPDGQTGERVVNFGATPSTPEAEWADPAAFERYAGAGDSAIWTGVATTADAYRYAVTGTDADYDRMIYRLKALLTKFDVTGVPGYLSRHHFLMLPEGSAPTPEHHHKIATPGAAPHRRDMPILEPSAAPDLPEAYLTGEGAPMWHGHPSIDQYSGPMMAFPIVWDLLRPEDAALKERIVRHMRCYLNRLQRIEFHNIQDNDLVADLVVSYFGGSVLELDEDDIDIGAPERAVAYVLRGINNDNYGDFDATCPDGPMMEPAIIVDGASDTFLIDALSLVQDMLEDANQPPRAGQIDHFYVPTLRGGDASHMMHLAAMLYRMTGEEQYRAFLFEELIGNLEADKVALTTQAFRLPDVCVSWYGDHITYPNHWQLITMLEDSPLRRLLVRVMQEEQWEKALGTHESAKFNVMYAALALDEQMSAQLPNHAEAAAQLLASLEGFGGPVENIDSPRRTYHLERQDVLDAMAPLGIGVRCPTEEERRRCEAGIEVAGLELEARTITYECDGRPGECVMEDGLCTEGIADAALPPQWRKYADFMWQRSPFQIGEGFGGYSGKKMSPGRDLSEPYWMARYYGFVTQGQRQVLAWQAEGACEEAP